MRWQDVPCVIGATQRPDRYRLTHRGGRVVYMHQQAWRDTHGPVPRGLFVCHHCDVRACAEVRHLYLGTNRQNMQDASARGRLVRSDETRAKLRAARAVQYAR